MNVAEPYASDLVSRRWRRGVLREVYIPGDGTVVKRYRVRPGTRRFARAWVMEHEALLALEGAGFPKSYGYYEQPGDDGGLRAVFSREYVAGDSLAEFAPADAEETGRLLACLHARRVVTDDACARNFVRTPAGQISFIDFGRAQVYRRASLPFLARVARELARVRREAFRDDGRLWTAFRKAYLEACELPGFQRVLVSAAISVSAGTRAARKWRARVIPLGDVERARARGHGIRTGRYRGGRFVALKTPETITAVEEFISQRRFLDEESTGQIPSHNRRYRVRRLELSGSDRLFVIKESFASSEYPLGRRLNIMLLQWLRNYTRRAFFGALLLRDAGVPTIRPAASWHYRQSALRTRRYFLYEYIEASYTVRQYRLNSMGLEPGEHAAIMSVLIRKTAGLVAAVHANRLVHDDVALGNFLVTDTGADGEPGSRLDVAVIDTDHVKRVWRPTGLLRRFLALRCLRRLDLDLADRRVFMQHYLGQDYSESWWRVAEFWRVAGKRPLKTFVNALLGKRKKLPGGPAPQNESSI